MEKLSELELESLKTSRVRVFDIKNSIADIVMMESKCSKDKAVLLPALDDAISEYAKVQEEITAKHGNINVDLATGEIVHNGD